MKSLRPGRGEAPDLNTLADLFASASPDLVLLDWELLLRYCGHHGRTAGSPQVRLSF
jgi:hypothetical protein